MTRWIFEVSFKVKVVINWDLECRHEIVACIAFCCCYKDKRVLKCIVTHVDHVLNVKQIPASGWRVRFGCQVTKLGRMLILAISLQENKITLL